MTYRVGSFLIAESVARNQEGRDVISGVLTAVAANHVQTVSAYAELFVEVGGEERVLVSVRLVGPDGAMSDVITDLPVTLNAGEPSVPIVLRGRLEVRKRGLYELQLLVGGQVIADRPLLATDREGHMTADPAEQASRHFDDPRPAEDPSGGGC